MKYALLIYPQAGQPRGTRRGRVQVGERRVLGAPRGLALPRRRPPAAGETATTVSYGGDENLIIDGPFADTKEVLGGYYVFDASNLDDALELAQRIPAVRLGGAVEVRPLVEVPVETAH